MVVLAVLLTIGVFVSIVGLIVALSGRRYPDDSTTPRSAEVGYDNPYPGWNIWTSQRAPVRRGVPEGTPRTSTEKQYRDDFEQWEAEHWPNQGQ